MSTHLSRFVRLSAVAVTAVAVGCATTSKTATDHPAKASHAAKTPKTEISINSAEKAEDPRSATELLREAEQAFQTANAAQERGDYEAALRHYNKMLELLVKADLDPGIFYNLRGEFEQILAGKDTTHARLFDPNDPNWTKKVVPPQGAPTEMPPAMVPGDLKMPETLAQRVQSEIQEIQEVYPRNFQYGLNRSAKYVPYIQAEFRKARLPEDLVWLAMVESQFTPKINSPAGAGGMWQFMRATGARYGLRVDSYVDERYNWEKSTKAAIAYLTDLGARFDGEWPLAVSAYNMGEGGMERAVAMNDGTRELIDLIERPPAANVLKMETKKFYPKLLASIIVAKNPEQYGFKPANQTPDEYTRIPVRGCYSLAALDSASGLPEGTLRQLNPDLIRGVTPPTGEHMLAVPVSAQERFVTALASVPQEKQHRSIFSPRGETREAKAAPAPKSDGASVTHLVKRGETLSSIADRYGVDVHDLATANRMRTNHRLVSGRKLTVPGASAKAEATVQAAAPASEPAKASAAETKTASADARTYKVRKGDTLFEIAKREGCSIDNLAQWNGLKRGSELQAGQSLKLYTPAGGSTVTASASPSGNKVEHVVKPGETPAKIASRYGVKLDELAKWNNLKNGTIYKDQKLTVYCSQPAPAAEAKAETSKSTTHKVASGETASTIADKYDVALADLMAWNKLKKNSVLRPGQELAIKGSSGAAKADKAEKAEPKKAEAKQTVHTVKKGDTPGGIADKYGVKLSELRAWNGWGKNTTLQLGQKVVIKK